jgi:glycosyltransferase involved in cell wall biosynthesis
MNICFVTPEYITEKESFDGGLSNYLFRLVVALKQFGHNPFIVVASKVNEVIIDNGIEIHRVASSTDLTPVYLQWCYQSFVLNNYIEEIAKIKPIDILQYASYTLPSLFCSSTIPSICRISSYEPYSDLYYDITISEEEKNSKYSLEKIAFISTNAIFGPCKIIAEAIEKDFSIGTIPIVETPFYNDVKQFDNSVYVSQLQNKNYFLFFGTLSILKGIKTIATIVDELLDKHPQFLFVFIGKQTSIEGKKAMDYIYAKTLKNRNRILYIPALKHAQLYPIIANAEVCILPSRIDNFPNCCIEAMFHKKIVIGTLYTGFNQLITHGKNGFLCERDNPMDLFTTIETVLNLSNQEKQAIELEAYKRTLQLSPEKVVLQLLELYKITIADFNKEADDEKHIKLQKEIQSILFKVMNTELLQYKNESTEMHARLNELLNSKTYIFGNIILAPFRKIKTIVLNLVK